MRKNRESVLLQEEAQELIANYVGDSENYHVEERSTNCESFPCPTELESWSGETNAIFVYNLDMEEVYAVAYWC